MATLTKTSSVSRQVLWAPAATLARWQLRRVWRLLLLTCAGMIAAVVLACSIPLYSWVTMTAGLRSIFTSPPQNEYIAVQTVSLAPSAREVQDASESIAENITPELATYISKSPQMVVYTPGYAFDGVENDTAATNGSNLLMLLGQDMTLVQQHVELIKGRLPQEQGSGLEIAILEETARYFQVDVGATLSLEVPYSASIRSPDEERRARPGGDLRLTVPLQVTGLLQVRVPSDPFWHDFRLQTDPGTSGLLLKAMVPNMALVRALENIAEPKDQVRDAVLLNPVLPVWYYNVDISRIDANRIDELSNGLNEFTTYVPTFVDSPPVFNDTKIQSSAESLARYRDHIAIAQLPTAILSILIIGLVVFFVSLMADLLVARQTASIAILRSRGASQQQVFSALLIQCLCLALVALVVGPLLALPTVIVLIQSTLADGGEGALALLTMQPFQALWQVRWLLLGTVAAAAFTMALATRRALNMDVLTLRCESARSNRAPFWQRLYLDVFAAVVALVCYAISAYMINADLLDARTRVLLQGPLILVSSIALLLAGALLFLRIFPLLLRLGMRVATRGRSIVPVLGLGMMARVPQQALRMILLLTFTLAFVVFSLVFNASQTQHMDAVASYQTGSDFSGSIVTVGHSKNPAEAIKQKIENYQRIPGVTAATVGRMAYMYTTTSSLRNDTAPLKLLAVDPTSFVAATSWAEHKDAARLKQQVQQLGSQRGQAQREGVNLPALVDEKTRTMLHLQEGETFELHSTAGTLTFVVTGVVASIPSVNDNAGVGQGEPGMVVDFPSLAAASIAGGLVDTQDELHPFGPNFAWLRTREDAQALASVREELKRGDLRLYPLNDRREILEEMRRDPLYLNFLGVLALGALAPILLALVGNLLVSWWNARSRVSNFVVLRAIGSSPQQLTGVLLCEQIVVYATAVILGILFGLLLSTLTLPALVFTSIEPGSGVIGQGSNMTVFTIQNVPPVEVVISPLLVVSVGGLILICILALWVMLRTVTHPSISQTLRVNED